MKSRGALLPRFVLLCSVLLIILIPEVRAEMTHVVKKGESLSTVARKYQLSIAKIQQANDLQDTLLQIGQRLTIPQQPAGVTASSEGNGPQKQERSGAGSRDSEIPKTHIVQKGETLTGIAKRYNLLVEDLREANDLKGSKIKVGQVLRVQWEEEDQENFETYPGGREAEARMAQVPERAAFDREKDPLGLARVAHSFLGVKYRRGGASVASGFDCSAYVQKVFRMVGFDLPRTAREQFEVGLEVARDALRMGDLVFFRSSKASRPAHVGIYLGNDQFIHSSVGKRRVNIDSLNTRYFSARFIGGRRMEGIVQPPAPEKPGVNFASIRDLSFEPAFSPSPLSHP